MKSETAKLALEFAHRHPFITLWIVEAFCSVPVGIAKAIGNAIAGRREPEAVCVIADNDEEEE